MTYFSDLNIFFIHNDWFMVFKEMVESCNVFYKDMLDSCNACYKGLAHRSWLDF